LKINIAFISLGCDKNSVDSEVMLGLLSKAGYNIISDEAKADVIIVNTCCFIQSAIEESIENILEVSEYKKTGNCKAIIVTGCMAERYKEEMFNEMPEVDAILGTTTYEKIVETIEQVLKGKKIHEFNDIDYKTDEVNSQTRILTTAGYYGYLKIAEGCNNFCTYCIIPKVRGKYRSRSVESLVEEANMLVNQGVKELIIVAQDTTQYGIDLYGKKQLPELLKKLAAIEDLEWIRLLYCYPEQITDELIDTIANEPKICKYLDMPIQHANDNILKKMARRSSQSQIREVIAKLREKAPEIALRTTLITGFPGETDAEFNDMLDFIKDVEFDRLGVFTYSQEEGTPASKYENQIDEEIKLERKEIILEAQKFISAKKCEQSIGKTFKVLVEGKLPEDNIYCGRTYKDSPDIDGLVFIHSEEELISGDFVSVKINEAYDYDLVGVIVDELSE
jgi:ribosomal protein S12 methylthiotransferase